MKKKNMFFVYVALLMATLTVTCAAKTAYVREVNSNMGSPRDTMLILSDNSLSGGNLQAKIDAKFGNNYGDLRKLVIRAGELTPEDCRFIKKNLLNLEELIIEENADFVNGVIPKGAFEGLRSLKKVKVDNAKIIEMKAFSLCEGLEEVDFHNVIKTGVQAFAQAKGSSTSQLRSAKFPKLQSMEPRLFYYCTNLEELYFDNVPEARRPESKEGLWFERVTKMIIHVPSKKVYENFVKAENCLFIDWSAFNFVADNGEELPKIEQAADYNDADYDYLRNDLLPVYDKTDKDFSGKYYTGDFKLSLNMYTFNMNINAWMSNSSSTRKLSTLDAIKWAAENGFDAVDVTCYYIPGYSNTAMPSRPEKEVLDYAKDIKNLCAQLKIEISGTGLQNNFADPNEVRRKTDIERIKFWIKVASEMGAPVIRIFAGPPPADIRREGWEKIAKDRIAPAVREVARYAKEYYPNVRIGLQNHGGMLATANQVIQVLKWINCDNVGIINDTGFYREFLNTDATKYDWYRDIALVLPYSNNFQVKKKPAGAETDELMDLDRLMRDIRKSPYRGYIPVELLWVNKDEGYPGNLKTPPYEETKSFLNKLKKAMENTKKM